MKIRTGWFFFFLSMITVFPLRIYQRLFSLEINIGFPKVGDHTLELLLALLVLFTILFVWSCASDKRKIVPYQPRRNYFAGLFALLLTASVAVESVTLLMLEKNDSVLSIFRTILGVVGLLAAIFFILTAADAFRGANSYKKHPYMSLVLPVWALVRLTVNFMQFNTETGQENMFDSFALIGCLLFLYSQSRLLVDIDREKALKTTFSFGFICILTGFICIAPRYIGYFLVNYYHVNGVSEGIYRAGLSPYPTNLLFSLYAFAFLIGLYFSTYKNKAGKDIVS